MVKGVFVSKKKMPRIFQGKKMCCRGTLKGALVNLIATSMFSSQNIGGLEIETEAIEYIIPLISLSGTWSECRLYDEL